MTPRRAYWLGLFGSWLLRALSRTWRLRVTGDVTVTTDIYALLHAHLLLPTRRFRRDGVVAMISRHGDGELIAQAVLRLGYGVVRGSSTRGASSAVLELQHEHAAQPWLVTPDGPKGPRGSVKAGLIRLAADNGRSIRPMAGAARPCKQFASWDRFTLPWPFAKVVVHFGPALRVPRDIDAEGSELLARELERALADCEKSAQSALANW